MTLEEWLNKQIEDAREDCLNQDIETYEDGYAEGYKDALQLVLDMLPSFDHDVTLREVKRMCEERTSCKCPFGGGHTVCMLVRHPSGWDIDEIQKSMKEVQQ